ncbi:hypothetical protein LTR99_001060 [Exophiala xenobiotica]|uniref:Uncharacterized protein n=1 Tax=Vermiconidia calcicola TaxID=1690605 RepID=A0AAV9QKF7_9PEZI|nr:hypothetical protein LTR92_001492 [Exophiala xenobiotica]KAK5545623.1 hypothetical protein LTR25_000630 [Vermiconidia calcicola]KAK5550115.1 hypothetical protein LTR23_000409 [Chaetothyriales sp. CCFEE 6169]KAK5271780.1 hypothetical protein LTR96_003608 [Exophiala xenobiotica]KAK5308088.1 hypothetical protein LTR99_001060 [Exophiala xenobiotica]
MSFFNANQSFFLDAMASRQLPIVVNVLPLNDVEVFQYLDAHPDALVRYLTERVGLAESLIRTLAPPQDRDDEAAPEKGSNDASDDVVADDDDSESVIFVSSGVCDEQAVVESDEGENDNGEVDDDNTSVDSEASEEDDSQAGPEVNPTHAVEETNTSVDSVASEEDGYQAGPEVNPTHAVKENATTNTPTSSSSNSGSSSTTTPSATPITPPQSSPPQPYPARADDVAASRLKPEGKKWRLFEEESCIRHMLDIRNENQLQGEARFAEAQRRMASMDGIKKDGKFAVKNFWNRVGRARSGFDERKNKKAPLATSRQGKSATSSSSRAGSTPRKRKATASTTSKTKRKYKSESDSEEEDPVVGPIRGRRTMQTILQKERARRRQ